MTTVAAQAILAIPTSTPAASNTPDAPGGAGPALDATRQLQALVADGWSLTRLADAAGIDERTAWRTVHRYTAPSPRTTAAVDALYEQLRFDDPGDGAAAVRSRRRAERQGWTSTIDLQGPGDGELVDEVAVDRVLHGQPVPLRAVEQQAALRRLAGVQSDDEIARRLGLASRTVLRHRLSQGLPGYTPVPPSAGPPVEIAPGLSSPDDRFHRSPAARWSVPDPARWLDSQRLVIPCRRAGGGGRGVEMH